MSYVWVNLEKNTFQAICKLYLLNFYHLIAGKEYLNTHKIHPSEV